MKKLFCISIVAITALLLNGCYGKGSSAAPPDNFTATAEDGRVELTWTAVSGVDYWIFSDTDPALTPSHLTGLNQYIHSSATTPFYMCGLIDTYAYYFAANGRTNGGPGGPASPTKSATPYNASDSVSWSSGSTGSSTDLNGVGYAGLTTCANNTNSAAGIFAAVGAGGTVYTSYDGQNWNSNSSPISSDLYAVAGYAANQNKPTDQGLRLVAVGAGGASIYSFGLGWYIGNEPNVATTANPNSYALRSITHVSGSFFAVGDSGTILSCSDGISSTSSGITWTARTSNTSNNLNGIAHGGVYVAVGDSGTILTSSDGSTWTVRIPLDQSTNLPSPITANLRQVAAFTSSYGRIYVAVGDAGTVVTSTDGTTWYTHPALTGSDLVGIVAETRAIDTNANPAPTKDTYLNFISTAQFVAVDSGGNAYTSVDGYIWSAAITTGASSLNALVSSGFGYVAVGNAGVTAYDF